MEICCNCKKEFLDKTEYFCSDCRAVLCNSCWSNRSGMCNKCYDKYHVDMALNTLMLMLL